MKSVKLAGEADQEALEEFQKHMQALYRRGVMWKGRFSVLMKQASFAGMLANEPV